MAEAPCSRQAFPGDDAPLTADVAASLRIIVLARVARRFFDRLIRVFRLRSLRKVDDAAWRSRILEKVEIVGVEQWADSAVSLRCRFKVAPIEQWNGHRAYLRRHLRRLKHAFDAAGIEIPYPHRTIYPGQGQDGDAPPLHVVTASRS